MDFSQAKSLKMKVILGNYTVNLPSWFPTAEGCQVVFPAKHTKHAKKVCITPVACGRKVRTSVRPAVVWKAMLSAAAIPHGLARHCVPRRCQAPRAVLSMPVKTPDAQRTAECPGRDGRKKTFEPSMARHPLVRSMVASPAQSSSFRVFRVFRGKWL